MKLLFTFALLVAIHDHGTCHPTDSKEELLSYRKTEPRACMKAGIMCKSCTELVNCIRSETGELQENDLVTCNSNFPCDEVAGGCVYNGICRNGPFICPRSDSLEPIDYPDIYDCRKYHTCTGRNDEVKTCDATKNQAWDPRRGDCAKAENLCKSYPVPLCREEGDMGLLTDTLYSFRCYLGFEDEIDILFPRLKWNSTSA